MERLEIAETRIDVDVAPDVFRDLLHGRYDRFSAAAGVAPYLFRPVKQMSTDLDAVEIDSFARAAVTDSLLTRGGCLFHAAGIVVDGLAYLFPGPSGVGKSTIATLAQAPLSDDICVVIPEGGGFTVHATPWWIGCAKSAPLAGIYTLSWNDEAIVGLSRAAGLRHLVTHILLFVKETNARLTAFTEAAFNAVTRIAAATPFGRLSFTKQTDVDDLIRRGRSAA